MPRTKISEFSATPGNNTDIDGINLAEGCAPSGINDAIRELMAQLKDFQAGTAGDSFNGPIGTTTPAAGVFTNLSASGTFALTGDQVQISEGGTGQTTANAAFNALAPSQTSQAGKYLKTDGTNTSWDALDISTADITGTLPIANGGTGLTALGTGVQTALGQNVTGSGGIVLASSPSLTTPNLGTPSAVTLTNATGLPLSTGVTGTLATTNGGTGLTSFTANGVVYASSSSALTTGSALVFDGTSLGVGAPSPQAKVHALGSGSGAAEIRVQNTSSSTDSRSLFRTYSNASTFGGSLFMTGTSDSAYPTSALCLYNFDNLPLVFGVNNTEGARLTTTGLGIGTSSPASKLDVVISDNGNIDIRQNASASTGFLSWVDSDGERAGRISYDHSTNALRFATAASGTATEKMRLDSSGNLGLGVTPSAWGSTWKALQLSGGSVAAGSDRIWMYQNVYINSANQETYISNAPATAYRQYNGSHNWNVAAAGTGNITFTQAMTLDASGQLQIGTTSPDGQFTLNNATAPYMSIRRADSTVLLLGSANSLVSGGSTADGAIRTAGNLSFATGGNTERARITSGGYLLVNGGGSALGIGDQYVSILGTGGSSALLATSASGNNASAALFLAASTTSYTANIVDIRTGMASGTGFNAITYKSDTSTTRFVVAGNGDVTNTNNSYGAISDIKLKENITDATPKLASLNQLRVVNYNFKGSDLKQIGLVAQEVEQVFPGLVETSADRDAEGNDLGTTTKSVKYSVLVPMLLKAVQELTAMNDDLRARVAQLEAK